MHNKVQLHAKNFKRENVNHEVMWTDFVLFSEVDVSQHCSNEGIGSYITLLIIYVNNIFVYFEHTIKNVTIHYCTCCIYEETKPVIFILKKPVSATCFLRVTRNSEPEVI